MRNLLIVALRRQAPKILSSPLWGAGGGSIRCLVEVDSKTGNTSARKRAVKPFHPLKGMNLVLRLVHPRPGV